MKKTIACCAALLLALLLAACARGTESVQEDQGGSGMPVESSEEAKTSEYSVEEVSFERDWLHIYGELYLPSGDEPHSLVVWTCNPELDFFYRDIPASLNSTGLI